MYHEQCPAYPCYCSTLLFGSLHSVGHGVHCPLSSCKNSLREATQCLCPATRSYLQRSALERAVLRNMCSFQLPLPLPHRVWRPSLVEACAAKIHRFPGDVRHAKSTVCARAHPHQTARRAGGLFKTIALRHTHFRQSMPGKDAQEQRPRFVPVKERQWRLAVQGQPVHITIPRRVNPQPLHLSLTLPRNTRCHARVCFPTPPSLFLPFSHSNHRANLYAIREFVCAPILSIYLAPNL